MVFWGHPTLTTKAHLSVVVYSLPNRATEIGQTNLSRQLV